MRGVEGGGVGELGWAWGGGGGGEGVDWWGGVVDWGEGLGEVRGMGERWGWVCWWGTGGVGGVVAECGG